MRPSDQARRPRIPRVFEGGATPSDGMQRAANARQVYEMGSSLFASLQAFKPSPPSSLPGSQPSSLLNLVFSSFRDLRHLPHQIVQHDAIADVEIARSVFGADPCMPDFLLGIFR